MHIKSLKSFLVSSIVLVALVAPVSGSCKKVIPDPLCDQSQQTGSLCPGAGGGCSSYDVCPCPKVCVSDPSGAVASCALQTVTRPTIRYEAGFMTLGGCCTGGRPSSSPSTSSCTLTTVFGASICETF